jgi:hypothetical protein
LALVYLAFLVIVAVESDFKHIKNHRALWFIAGDISSYIIVFVLFIGYWANGVIQEMGGSAPYCFLFSLLWRLGVALQTLHENSDTSKRLLQRLGSLDATVAILVLACLTVPIFWFAGLAAFKPI